MPENTITQLPDPSGFIADAFTDVLRNGARKLIEQAIHAELTTTLMAAFSKETLEDGRARRVRHGPGSIWTATTAKRWMRRCRPWVANPRVRRPGRQPDARK